jgi:hypothetical protein
MIVFSTHKMASQKKALRFSHLREKVSVSGRREALILRGAIVRNAAARRPLLFKQAPVTYGCVPSLSWQMVAFHKTETGKKKEGRKRQGAAPFDRLRKNGPFLSACPMFVPSLSW